MKRATMLLVNHTIPVEPFLRDEIPYLRRTGAAISLLPTECPKFMETCEGLPLSRVLSSSKGEKLFQAFLGLGNSLLHRAIRTESVPLSPSAIARLVHYCAATTFNQHRLREYIWSNNLEDVPLLVYTYWFGPATYASFLLKRELPHLQVVTRAHGIDLFSEQSPDGYLPLRATGANWADMICPCSLAGKKTLLAGGSHEDRIHVAPLGVPRSSRPSSPSEQGHLHLVSCSYMSDVKRLPLLVSSLAAYARSRPHVHLHWTHMGGKGKPFDAFAALAKDTLTPLRNISFHMPGKLSLEKVRDFYQENAVDGLVNTSRAEGVPVSMMEAISAGVPIVGTNVGGVADLVNERTGIMLRSDFSVSEFIDALDQLTMFKKTSKRLKIMEFFLTHFCRDNNYSDFVSTILVPAFERSATLLSTSSQQQVANRAFGKGSITRQEQPE